MKHYILYSHDGSGNHGCEALVRTTIELLKDKNSSFTLSSTRPEEDIKYGINELCVTIQNDKKLFTCTKEILKYQNKDQGLRLLQKQHRRRGVYGINVIFQHRT